MEKLQKSLRNPRKCKIYKRVKIKSKLFQFIFDMINWRRRFSEYSIKTYIVWNFSQFLKLEKNEFCMNVQQNHVSASCTHNIMHNRLISNFVLLQIQEPYVILYLDLCKYIRERNSNQLNLKATSLSSGGWPHALSRNYTIVHCAFFVTYSFIKLLRLSFLRLS